MIRTSYASLPERFYSRSIRRRWPAAMIVFNRPLATELQLDIDGLDADALAGLFPAMCSHRIHSRLRWRMPDTSSVNSCRSLAMDGQSFWEKGAIRRHAA